MSKLMGKKILEKGIFSENELVFAAVKYEKTSDIFAINVGFGNGYERTVKVNANVLFLMTEVDKEKLGLFDAWSLGYMTRILLDDDKEIKKRELDYIWKCLDEVDEVDFDCDGRLEILKRGWLDSDSDYNLLCVVQYLFKLGKCALVDAKRQWKRCKWGKSGTRWVELEKRVDVKANVCE